IGLENLLSLKFKVIRCDNGTEFKNSDLNPFCGLKGIKREFSIPRTPQQNGIAERKNRTLIKAARTLLADSLLPISFWAEAVNTACYVQNRVGAQTRKQGDKTENKDKGKSPVIIITGFRDLNAEFEECTNNSRNGVNAASSLVSTAGQNCINSTNDFSSAGPSNTTAKADINNLESIISVSPIPTTRIHKDHSTSQIIGDLSLTTQTRSMARVVRDQGGISQMFNEDFHTSMFACFLSQEEPKREEGIDYEEVFAPVAMIKAIRLFLAYASFMGFPVYQMDVKSAFLYGTIDEEVYVCQPPGFEDPKNHDKVYKVVKALYGLHQAPRA
nr:putative ribonuclease H-like domain-containing protein [Tanacetum cinerariifolium]